MVGVIEKHLKNHMVVDHSQHSFMRRKLCLIKLISFYDKVAHLVDLGKPTDVSFWISENRLMLFLTISFWTKCPAYS